MTNRIIFILQVFIKLNVQKDCLCLVELRILNAIVTMKHQDNNKIMLYRLIERYVIKVLDKVKIQIELEIRELLVYKIIKNIKLINKKNNWENFLIKILKICNWKEKIPKYKGWKGVVGIRLCKNSKKVLKLIKLMIII